MSSDILIIVGTIASVLTILTVVGGGMYWFGKFGSNVQTIKDDTREMRRTLSDILIAISGLAKAGSPVRLTKRGEQIAKTLSVYEWADNKAKFLEEKTRGLQQFEIFQECQDYMHEQLTQNLGMKRDISKAAYDHGVSVAAIEQVYAIVLRDALIERLGPVASDGS